MSDTPQATPTTTPLGNDPTARNPDGSIKDPAATPSDPAAGDAPSGDPATPAAGETKPEAKSGAPEKYETFKAPEGYTLSDAIVSEVSPMFKEMNLTQADAQRLIDFHGKEIIKAATAPQEAYANLRKEWQTQLKTDLGDKYEAAKADFGRFLATLPQDARTAFSEAMDLTGAGDHPAFVKVMLPLIQHVIEGKHVTGGNPSPAGQAKPGDAPKSAASRMWPNLPSAS